MSLIKVPRNQQKGGVHKRKRKWLIDRALLPMPSAALAAAVPASAVAA
jgi:hypothetical protein